MLSIILKLISIMNSEVESEQISLAFCFSMVMGFTPLFSLHNILVLLLVLILRINISAFLFGWAVFSGIAYLLDPIFHSVGYGVLTSSFLNGVWTSLYNVTIVRLANFNNTIVMGSLFISLTLFIPAYFTFNILIKRYRDHVIKWLENTKIFRIFRSSKLYLAYQAVTGLGGKR